MKDIINHLDEIEKTVLDELKIFKGLLLRELIIYIAMVKNVF